MNVDVKGPEILFEIPVFGGIGVSETIVNSWIIMAVIALVCFFLGRNLKVKNPSKRQLVAEKAVTMITNLVTDVMGEKNAGWAPYIGTLLIFSAVMYLKRRKKKGCGGCSGCPYAGSCQKKKDEK